MGESDFEPVQAGEVPVCPITSPVWSVLFPSVGALVTDTGAAFLPPGLVNGYRKIERS